MTVNGLTAVKGTEVNPHDEVKLDTSTVRPPASYTTILFHKPIGYVCSRNGQGSATIFDLLPPEYQSLQPIGRLDKDSSGLLLLTNDGHVAEQLSHPRYGKTKVYTVLLDKPLQPLHKQMIVDYGVMLEDGPSRFQIATQDLPTPPPRVQHERPRGANGSRAGADSKRSGTGTSGEANLSPANEKPVAAYEITMQEGRNRQIRRTFAALGYTVTDLHRTQFGPYGLGDLPVGKTMPLRQLDSRSEGQS